jgi:hypothetical protein
LKEDINPILFGKHLSFIFTPTDPEKAGGLHKFMNWDIFDGFWWVPSVPLG